MTTIFTKLTFPVTEEMETLLANAKKNLFSDRTQSEMIRELLLAGLDATDKKAAKEKQSPKAG